MAMVFLVLSVYAIYGSMFYYWGGDCLRAEGKANYEAWFSRGHIWFTFGCLFFLGFIGLIFKLIYKALHKG